MARRQDERPFTLNFSSQPMFFVFRLFYAFVPQPRALFSGQLFASSFVQVLRPSRAVGLGERGRLVTSSVLFASGRACALDEVVSGSG